VCSSDLCYNSGNSDWLIEKYSRIAQGALRPVPEVELVEVDNIDKTTERSNNGFGSSGIY
jgi:dUTPase